MTDATLGAAGPAAAAGRLGRLTAGPRPTFEQGEALTRRRYAREARLKWLGVGAIATAGALLLLLLGTIVAQGKDAFFQTYLRLDVTLDPAKIDPQGTRDPAVLARAAPAGRSGPGRARRPRR
jgi:hypothetical protein